LKGNGTTFSTSFGSAVKLIKILLSIYPCIVGVFMVEMVYLKIDLAGKGYVLLRIVSLMIFVRVKICLIHPLCLMSLDVRRFQFYDHKLRTQMAKFYRLFRGYEICFLRKFHCSIS